MRSVCRSLGALGDDLSNITTVICSVKGNLVHTLAHKRLRLLAAVSRIPQQRRRLALRKLSRNRYEVHSSVENYNVLGG